jgi:1-acyl-sn-glycerol-3-phosphate acyltransferase
MLPAVARYLEVPDLVILPVGIVGTETLFPIGDEAVHPARVVVRAGVPIEAADLVAAAGGNRRELMERVGAAIALQLPAEFRGVYER